jgi:rRNA maturation endonuclease Nob1
VSDNWHIECLVCGAQYYLADYPKKGCRNCGRDALLITDNRAGYDREREVVGSHRNKLTSES